MDERLAAAAAAFPVPAGRGGITLMVRLMPDLKMD
jgi:hypothetical protein